MSDISNELYDCRTAIPGKTYNLYDLAKWKNGLAFKKIDFSDSGIPVIKIAELNSGIGPTTAYTKGTYSEEVHLFRGDMVFSWSGNPQTSIDVFWFPLDEGWLNQHIFKVTPYENIVLKEYLYYLMKSLKPVFTTIASNKQTTGLGHVTISDLKELKVTIPDLEMQRRIVELIKPFDDKINKNNEIEDNLLEQSKVLYKAWFIDFELFDGEMPSDWHDGTVEEIIELHDSKRKPLSGREREMMDKIYPYYGATSIMDYVDDYIFDGVYLLLGEDGSVINLEGYPILQYVFGKFWPNNHAHIITGKNGYSVEMLYLLFSMTNVQNIVTGAVQLKISQQNLKKVEAVIP